MRFCMQCGKQNDDNSLFCTSCGQRMEAPLAVAQPEPDVPVSVPQPAVEPAYVSRNTPAHAAPASTWAPEPEPAPEPVPFVPAQVPEPEPVDAAAPATVPEQMVQATMELFAAPFATGDETVAPEPEPEPEAEPEAEPEPEPEPVPESTPDSEPAAEGPVAGEALDELAGRLAAIEEGLESLSQRFDDKISRNEHEATILRNMSDEMQEYRDGLYAKLTTPLVRDLIEAREALGAALERNAQAPDAAKLAADVSLCRDMIADALARNEVQIVESQEGDEFASFKHKIVGKVHTDDDARQGKVAEVSGASYKLGEQFIAPAMVKVYTTEQVGE